MDTPQTKDEIHARLTDARQRLEAETDPVKARELGRELQLLRNRLVTGR